MDYLSHNIAVNLKRIRTSKGMSLDVAAEQTGVSKSMLHQIERGCGNPSINVLGKIISGLRIEFNDLISEPAKDTYIIHAKDLVPTKEIPGQYEVRTCFPYEDNKTVEIYKIDIEPGGEYVSGGHGEKTREYIAVTENEVTIQVDDVNHRITSDDFFRFNSEHTHKYINNTDKRTSLLCFFVIE